MTRYSFPLPCCPSLTFSYSYAYTFAHTNTVYRNNYDVSRRKCEGYDGGSYAILAGKDGSNSWTVCMSSFRTEDAVEDCSMLKEST
jgi:hypothetical protein